MKQDISDSSIPKVIAGLTDRPDTLTGQAGNTNLMFPTVTAAPPYPGDGQGWVYNAIRPLSER